MTLLVTLDKFAKWAFSSNVKRYFHTCFDNLIKIYASHHYYTMHKPYDNKSFIYVQACLSDKLSFKRSKQALNTLKLI